MRKYCFIIVLLFTFQVTVAQRGRISVAASYFTQGQLNKAKETIDAVMKEKGSDNWVRANLLKGQIYQALYETTNSEYKRLSNNALDVAWEAYKKVIELDRKERYRKDIRTQYQNLAIDFINQGSANFKANKPDKALEDFKRVLEIHKSSYGNQKIDTIIIYNVAISAQMAGKRTEALHYYKKSLDLNYEPVRTYAMIAKLLLEESNNSTKKREFNKAREEKEEALRYLEEGNRRFPNDRYLLVELINYYLSSEEPETAEQYLNMAIEREPKNAEFYRVKGTLYERLKIDCDAEDMYRKALEIDPDDFISQYNLANLLLKRVVNRHKELYETDDVRVYNSGIEHILNEYEEVIPYFERANELAPDDINILKSLNQLYYLLRNRDSSYQEKYEKVKAILEK